MRFWLTALIVMALIAGCSSGDIPSEFLEDRKHLSAAFMAFDKANEMSQVPEGMTSYTPPPGAEDKIQSLLQKGLREGDSIRNEFLDWLHPEMKMYFRDKFMRGHRLVAEGRKEDSVIKQTTGIELIGQWYNDFWEKNVDAIYKKAFPKG